MSANPNLDIINNVLNLLGRIGVAAIEDDDDAVLISQVINDRMSKLLSEASWYFSTKVTILNAVVQEDNPDSEYSYAYQIPADYLNLVSVEDMQPFTRVGDMILSNQYKFKLYYVAFIENVFPAWNSISRPFKDALIHDIAAYVCNQITENPKLSVFFKNESTELTLKAKEHNAYQVSIQAKPYNDYLRSNVV